MNEHDEDEPGELVCSSVNDAHIGTLKHTTAGRTCSLLTARLTCHHGVTERINMAAARNLQIFDDDKINCDGDADAMEAATTTTTIK